ncbi:flavin monoamine oxidase family protein [Tenacibaculum sp. nBUS_03]|uniref:flavin monoamine oxidase family protein n=1 Tax=Tenacibaculum sp. nBUS_03 TaxID=3395320 RepID=UPI003EB7F67E
MQTKIVIIGAGLSGLLVGYQLKLAKIPFIIIEARDRVGGRIHTVYNDNSAPLEMGATWFGYQHTNLLDLLKKLEVSYFEQYMIGTSFFQPFSTSPASAIPIQSQPPSYRIEGGTSSIINKLIEQIGEDNILLNSTVKHLEFTKKNVTVSYNEKKYIADKIVLALPPKLWINNIKIEPTPPQDLFEIAINTHTWMENSIKVALSYEKAFWRKNKQSGTLFSNSGPITELYDHSNSTGNKYALCGFLNPSYASIDPEERKRLVLEQIVNVFGNEATKYDNYVELNWGKEDKTASNNRKPLFAHQNNGSLIFKKEYYNSRLLISSSESSSSYPGYMEGAVDSANFVYEKIKMANDKKHDND